MSLQKKIKTVTREEMRYTKTLRGIDHTWLEQDKLVIDAIIWLSDLNF